MKIFWISFSVFFITASIVGWVAIISWIIEAVRERKTIKAAVANHALKANREKKQDEKENIDSDAA